MHFLVIYTAYMPIVTIGQALLQIFYSYLHGKDSTGQPIRIWYMVVAPIVRSVFGGQAEYVYNRPLGGVQRRFYEDINRLKLHLSKGQ